jgi:hypothetical protein
MHYYPQFTYAFGMQKLQASFRLSDGSIVMQLRSIIDTNHRYIVDRPCHARLVLRTCAYNRAIIHEVLAVSTLE